MPLQSFLKTERCGPLLIVRLTQSVGSLAAETLHTETSAVLQAIESTPPQIVELNLADAPYFGSGLLQTIHRIGQFADQVGAEVRLCNASPVAEEVLRCVAFDRLWPITHSEPLAPASNLSA